MSAKINDNVRKMAAMFEKDVATENKAKDIAKGKLRGRHEVSANNDVVLNIIKSAGYGDVTDAARMRNVSVHGYEERNDFDLLGGSEASWVTWDTIQEDIDKLERELKEDVAKAENDLKNYSKDEENLPVIVNVDARKMTMNHDYYALAFDLEDEDTGNNDGFSLEDEVSVFDARTRAQKANKDFDLFIDSIGEVDFLEQMENETASERTVSEVPVKETVSKHLTVSKTKGNESFKGHVERMKAFFEAASAA